MTMYEYRCTEPKCLETVEVTEKHLSTFGAPVCKKNHKPVTMRRIYHANIVWPKDQRGH